MPLLTAEGLRSHYQSLGQRTELVEKAGFTQPATIAAAALAYNYEGCFWDTTAFVTRPIPKKLPSLLRESGLIDERRGSTRGDVRSYFIHFIGALASYDNQSTVLRWTFKALGLDPGIKAARINSQYSDDIRPSFWFSIGGDVLQDRMLGSVDEDEYRADLLGLRATRLYAVQPEALRLSEMFYDAAENVGLVCGDSYKALPDYQIADHGIRPMVGHKFVNVLSRFTPIFV